MDRVSPSFSLLEPMIAGFTGHLISEHFLAQRIAELSHHERASGLRDEFGRCRARQQSLGPASSLRTLFECAATPVVTILGFDVPTEVEFLENIALATLRTDGSVVVLLVAHWGERLDPLWRVAVVEARRRGASWCLLFNGTHLRLVNATRVFSRRYAEFDLDCIADDETTACATGMVLGAKALSPGGNRREAAVDALVDLSERHASAVCRSLRQGVLEASEHVLRALVARPHTESVNDAFEQSLTIVYRMLFLFFAEARSHRGIRSTGAVTASKRFVTKRHAVPAWASGMRFVRFHVLPTQDVARGIFESPPSTDVYLPHPRRRLRNGEIWTTRRHDTR
jgi:hypothetical protein